MSTRTLQLASRSLPAALTVLYTVPAGRVTILKNVRVQHAAGGASAVSVYAINAAGTAGILLLATNIAVGSVCAGLDSWMVLGPGDTLQALHTGANNDWQLWASGAQLPAP